MLCIISLAFDTATSFSLLEPQRCLIQLSAVGVRFPYWMEQFESVFVLYFFIVSLQRAQAERIPQAYTPFISGRLSRGSNLNGVVQVADGGYCPSVDRIFDHCLVLRFVQSDRGSFVSFVCAECIGHFLCSYDSVC